MLEGIYDISSHVFFRTHDVALANRSSIATATRQLQRMSSKGLIVKITRGLWSNPRHPYFTPLGCVPYLLDQEQGYVSFLTAMHKHNLISQIPRVIHIATTGHSRRLTTVIGVFEFFQLSPKLMSDGIDWAKSYVPYRIASAEKSLLDTLYLSTRKSRRFSALPEIDLSAPGFRKREFLRLLHLQITSPQIRNAITTRFDKLV